MKFQVDNSEGTQSFIRGSNRTLHLSACDNTSLTCSNTSNELNTALCACVECGRFRLKVLNPFSLLKMEVAYFCMNMFKLVFLLATYWFLLVQISVFLIHCLACWVLIDHHINVWFSFSEVQACKRNKAIKQIHVIKWCHVIKQPFIE